MAIDCTLRLWATNGLTLSRVLGWAIDYTPQPCSTIGVYSVGDADSILHRGALVVVRRASGTDSTREHHALNP